MTTGLTTRILSGSAALVCATVASAGVLGSQSYTDSSNDLFDNGFANLDITGVSVSNTATSISISVTTREFQNWTKYLLFMNTREGGTGSNGWGRPVDLNGAQIDYYIGSWVDAPSGNAQFWSFGTGWNLDSTFSNSVSGNTVTWTVSLASLGLSIGSTFTFDVATSGGGNDPGVDHLSRFDAATPGWGTASTSGAFLSYTVVPAPGALALVAAAGLMGASRRRR